MPCGISFQGKSSPSATLSMFSSPCVISYVVVGVLTCANSVTEKHSARQERLSSTWSFTCTCPRCMLEPHLLAESDSRVRQMRELSRELDDYSSAATPGQAELLVTLYELEGLHVRIYEAYYRAALEWNGAGDAARAVRYARLCLDKGLVLRGEDRPFVTSMREMVRDPKGHWSWRFRVEEKEKGQRSEGGA